MTLDAAAARVSLDRIVGACLLVVPVFASFLVATSANDDRVARLFSNSFLAVAWSTLLLCWVWPPLYGIAVGLGVPFLVFLGLAGPWNQAGATNGLEMHVYRALRFFRHGEGFIALGIALFILYGAVSYAFRKKHGARIVLIGSTLLYLSFLLLTLVFHTLYRSSPIGWLVGPVETQLLPNVLLFVVFCPLPWWLMRNGRFRRVDSDEAPVVVGVRVPEERFRIVPAIDERYEITLLDAPGNCVALEMAPRAREAILDAGRWLVLCASIWNGPDREAVGRLLEIATQFGPETHAGVRPFKHPHELATWCPDFAKESGSPIWIAYDRGRIVDAFVGTFTAAELLRRLPAGFRAPS